MIHLTRQAGCIALRQSRTRIPHSALHRTVYSSLQYLGSPVSKAAVGIGPRFFATTMGDAGTGSPRRDGNPINFGIVLFPGFQLLDACGPLDALNLLSQSYKMNLYVIAETMHPVSTKRPGRGQDDAAGHQERVGSVFEQHILPTHTFRDAPPLDVMIVPGGAGTRLVPNIEAAVAFIRETCHQEASLQYLITICTGAGLAARAGVLDGHRATTNKLAWEETVVLGPKVEWVRRARWVRADGGRIWTASGISAGIDVTFAWIAEVYGEEVAAQVARRMEYRRVTDSEDDPFADMG